MESFDLLVKYWRQGHEPRSPACRPTTASPTCDDRNDEGPLSDLEFAVSSPDDIDEVEDGLGLEAEAIAAGNLENEKREDEEDDMEGDEFRSDPTILSNAVIIIAAGVESDQAPATKPSRRLRVHLLKHGNPKSKPPENNPAAATAAGELQKQSRASSKFLVKFKIDEVPIVSLFIPDSSTQSNAGGDHPEEASTTTTAAASMVLPEEKKSPDSKDVVHKYLRKIKPIYIRISRRLFYQFIGAGDSLEQREREEKEHKTEHSAASTAEKTGRKSWKPAISAIPSIPTRLRVVYHRIGKSKSTLSPSSAAVLSPPLQPRDDSLLLQQDGIQSAIAHCKRSYTGSSKGEKPVKISKFSDGIHLYGFVNSFFIF
ncbi:putative membrane-associated kinase regulator 2 [Apostasia shenzhenica]|uniref:Putative membrane-associated kinase regulator 2 n=1 Tax=Apostasia shenzhenica TaxID=1088818 RepID=A0A2I0AFY2_9ASPA|nr:putative membrane-associated kinase regulator 2 [Apostasia shenzhenica]